MSFSASTIDNVLDLVDVIGTPLTDVMCLMIQSTGASGEIASTFYDKIDSHKQLAHYVVDNSGVVNYAYSNKSVIDPTKVMFKPNAIKMLTDPKNSKDNPAYHISVLEICLSLDYAVTEANAIKYVGEFIKTYGLSVDNIWRRCDIIAETDNMNIQYADTTNWNKFLAAIKAYVDDPSADIATGNVIPATSVIKKDTRVIKYTNLKSVDADKVSENQDYVTTTKGAMVTKTDKFTNQVVSNNDGTSNLYEPIYPDLTVPPSNATSLYNKKIANIKSEVKAIKPVLGKIVNNDDAYPVDTKIAELELHRPMVNINDITLTGNCTSPGCSLAENDAMIVGYLKELSNRSEKRLVQLENLTSTIMRYVFRLSSRMNINCVYYGGQAPYDKYNCIRCLSDDMINDGQIVSLDQCLNCSRYEPIIGQVYDILDDEMNPMRANILDDNQMARMSMKDYASLVSVDEMHTEGPDADSDLTKLSNKSSKVKGFEESMKKAPSFKMDWQEVVLETEIPDINIYNYDPIAINKDKANSLKPENKYDDGYKDEVKQIFDIPTGSYEAVDDSTVSNPSSIGAVRDKIVAKALALLQVCKDGKGQYSQARRTKTIDGIYYLDCSSFADTCYKEAGVKIGCYAVSKTQAMYCEKHGTTFKDMKQALPGDLVFYSKTGTASGVHHVTVYIGDGKCAGASQHYPNNPTNDWHINDPANYDDFLFFGRCPELIAVDKIDVISENREISMKFEEAFKIQCKVGGQVYNGSKWVNASPVEIREAMDPTKHLTFPDKYQFLCISGSNGLTVDQMKAYLKDSKATTSLISNAEAFIKAAKDFNISELYLASHCCLETGRGTSDYGSGKNSYNGKQIFNMYGIAVYDKTPGAGKKYAYDHGWFTQAEAIYGGAKWIAENYVGKGRTCVYDMRWNPMNPGTSQYATDINWCSSQVSGLAKRIEKLPSEITSKFKFNVPKYL